MNTLLQDIEQEISQSGGRYNLARRIMEENRYWFTANDRKGVQKKARAETIENYQPESRRYWTLADEEYLQANWNRRSQIRVAYKLKRSLWGCYQKYYKLTTTKKTTNRNYKWKQAS